MMNLNLPEINAATLPIALSKYLGMPSHA